MPTERSDNDVIKRAIQRDVEAFGEIYSRHSARIFRHIYYLTSSKQEADDLTSETFLQAWKAIHRYEDRGLPLENWLLRIGHNLAIKHLKRRRNHAPLEHVPAEELSSTESLSDQVAEEAVIRSALLALPGVQRQVIVWRFLESMSYGEVEVLLGKSQGAIRVIQHRALKNLRSLLEGNLLPKDKDAERMRAGKSFAGVAKRGVSVVKAG